MRTPPYALLPLAIASALTWTACDGDDDALVDDAPAVEIPATYSFENVSYTGQQERLAMLAEIKSVLQSAVVDGADVSAERLQAMYANEEGADFARAYGKQIKSKTYEPVREDYDRYFDTFAALAADDTEPIAGPGVAGRIASGEKTYLVDARGVEWLQVIEKGLMGATFYYQATTVYMGEERMSADNEVVTPGEGTDMEHHWDEAFGYLGVPRDYPTNTDDLQFWGTYTERRSEDLGTGEALMTALKKGRAAISAGALDVRDEAIAEARAAWELVAAGTAIHYLNSAEDRGDDLGGRLHDLSEAVAFAYALQFNEATAIDRAAFRTWLTDLAGGPDFESIDLYAVTDAEIAAAREQLAATYDLEDQARQL